MAKQISFDKFYNIINNEKIGSEKTYNAIDPSNGKQLWEVPIANEKDLDQAVTAANKAFKSWSALEHEERCKLMQKVADGLQAHKDDFTNLLYKETGKPVHITNLLQLVHANHFAKRQFAESEILMGVGTLRIHTTWTVPDQILKDTEEVKIVVQHAPIGVVGGITPWNYPFQLAILKIAAAIATGCAIILKPSPFTPYTALKIGEVAAQVLPPGVVQVLGGDDALGPWMTKHPGIAKISFTGSIPTGKKVMAAASETLKRVNLEMGGNDAAVVTEDFDTAKAAELVAAASFAHSGQVCMATKRIYVHESVYDKFMAHFVDVVKKYRAGEGFISPIQNEMQFDKVKSIYQDCEDKGYKFAIGSGKIDDSQSGYFVHPAIVVNPPEDSRLVQEEPFGPIIPVMTWRRDEEVIDRVNNTDTGLGGTVYCRNEKRAWQISSKFDTGSVWVNGGLRLDPIGLFGAHKNSGIGGELGPLGMKYYTETRCITYWKETSADEGKGFFS